MPLRIQSKHATGSPMWVDLSAATKADGTLDERLDRYTREAIEAYLREPETNGCISVGQASFETPQQGRVRDSLDTSIDTAKLVIEGEVVGESVGFMQGTPGRLIRVKTLESFKSQTRRDDYFIYLPVATVMVTGRRICKMDNRFPVIPQVGQRLFVLTAEPLGKNGELAWTENPDDIILVNPGGTVNLPPRWSAGEAAGPTSATDLSRYLRSRIASKSDK